MTNRMTFDPSEDPTPDMMAAQQATLEQGEKLINAQEEDRLRKFQQNDADQEDVSLIGGKFKSQEDLLKAYEELQRKMSSGESTDEEETSEEPVEGTEEEVESEEIISPAREAIDAASKAFEETGELSDESFAKVEDIVSVDSKVNAKVLKIDREHKRISLSIKEHLVETNNRDADDIVIGGSNEEEKS